MDYEELKKDLDNFRMNLDAQEFLINLNVNIDRFEILLEKAELDIKIANLERNKLVRKFNILKKQREKLGYLLKEIKIEE